MRILLAWLLLGLGGYIAAQPVGMFNRPMGGSINQAAPIAANNPFAGFNQPFNNPAAAGGSPAAGLPMNQPILSGGFNQPLSGMNQPIMGLNAFNNPLAQQTLPQQNLLQQPILGAAATPQFSGLNLGGLPDQQIQQLALQAAQPTLTQWLSSDHQAIFQRAGALNNAPLSQPIMAGAAAGVPPLQGVQAIQAMPNTLAALQQQLQQPLTQSLLSSNPNLAQWMQQQQLAMQQAVRGAAPTPQQFQIPGNSPVGQFRVDQGPVTGPNPQAIMMPSMQSRPAAPQSQTQSLPGMNQPILQGSLPLQQQPQAASPLPQFAAPDLQDFTLSRPSAPQQPNQASGPQQPLPQPILNQPSAPTQINPAGPQGMTNNPNAPIMNAPRPRP